MRYSSLIDNRTARNWGLTLQEAYLFEWMYSLPSWANKAVIDNDIFYFASKNKAIEELPLLTDKVDTMYRYYKSLENKGLILISKIGGKDYISLTEKAKEWNRGKSDHSDLNPTQLGFKSESNSDLNPTYNRTSINNRIKDKEEEKASTSFENSIPDFVLEEQKKITPHKAPPAPPTFEDVEQNMRDSHALRESVMRSNKIDEYEYLNLLELFFLETRGNDKVLKSVSEHKRHFQSWARIAIEKGLQTQPKKGKIQQNYEDAVQAAQSIIAKGNFKWKEDWEV